MILLCHSRYSAGFPQQFSDLVKHGEVGVTIFFVISGFLITTLLLAEEKTQGTVNVGAFYIRRAFRILPVFLLYTAFILLMKNYQPISLTTSNLIHALTFTVNFDPNNSWFLGHFWSLSVEEQFYLLWPLLLIFGRKHIQPILIVLILYGCVARVIHYKFPAYSALTLSPFFMFADAILLGALAAVVNTNHPHLARHKVFSNYWLQVLALSIFLLFIYLSGHGKMAVVSLPFGGLIISVCILFLILCYITPSNNLTFRLLNSKVMVHIGVLSYSLYVWQQFFFVGDGIVWYRTWPLNILVIYIVALASYHLWEQPFLRARKYVLNRSIG
jgi:peptidoglycan/LPS O-acetylase OafA/YrhL